MSDVPPAGSLPPNHAFSWRDSTASDGSLGLVNVTSPIVSAGYDDDTDDSATGGASSNGRPMAGVRAGAASGSGSGVRDRVRKGWREKITQRLRLGGTRMEEVGDSSEHQAPTGYDVNGNLVVWDDDSDEDPATEREHSIYIDAEDDDDAAAAFRFHSLTSEFASMDAERAGAMASWDDSMDPDPEPTVFVPDDEAFGSAADDGDDVPKMRPPKRPASLRPPSDEAPTPPVDRSVTAPVRIANRRTKPGSVNGDSAGAGGEGRRRRSPPAKRARSIKRRAPPPRKSMAIEAVPIPGRPPAVGEDSSPQAGLGVPVVVPLAPRRPKVSAKSRPPRKLPPVASPIRIHAQVAGSRDSTVTVVPKAAAPGFVAAEIEQCETIIAEELRIVTALGEMLKLYNVWSSEWTAVNDQLQAAQERLAGAIRRKEDVSRLKGINVAAKPMKPLPRSAPGTSGVIRSGYMTGVKQNPPQPVSGADQASGGAAGVAAARPRLNTIGTTCTKAGCGVELGQAGFLSPETGAPICEVHYNALMEAVCDVCGRQVFALDSATSRIKTEGVWFHSTCYESAEGDDADVPPALPVSAVTQPVTLVSKPPREGVPNAARALLPPDKEPITRSRSLAKRPPRRRQHASRAPFQKKGTPRETKPRSDDVRRRSNSVGSGTGGTDDHAREDARRLAALREKRDRRLQATRPVTRAPGERVPPKGRPARSKGQAQSQRRRPLPRRALPATPAKDDFVPPPPPRLTCLIDVIKGDARDSKEHLLRLFPDASLSTRSSGTGPVVSSGRVTSDSTDLSSTTAESEGVPADGLAVDLADGLKRQRRQTLVSIVSCQTADVEELDFEPGEILESAITAEEGWYIARRGNDVGFVSAADVRVIADSDEVVPRPPPRPEGTIADRLVYPSDDESGYSSGSSSEADTDGVEETFVERARASSVRNRNPAAEPSFASAAGPAAFAMDPEARGPPTLDDDDDHVSLFGTLGSEASPEQDTDIRRIFRGEVNEEPEEDLPAAASSLPRRDHVSAVKADEGRRASYSRSTGDQHPPSSSTGPTYHTVGVSLPARGRPGRTPPPMPARPPRLLNKPSPDRVQAMIIKAKSQDRVLYQKLPSKLVPGGVDAYTSVPPSAIDEVERTRRLVDMATIAIPSACYGYLSKKNKIRNVWKRRWYILRDDCIESFASFAAYNEGAARKSVIDLRRGISCIQFFHHTHENTFLIITGERDFYFYAETEEEREEWIHWLTRAIEMYGLGVETTTVVSAHTDG